MKDIKTDYNNQILRLRILGERSLRTDEMREEGRSGSNKEIHEILKL
jgi:hypothetical protein